MEASDFGPVIDGECNPKILVRVWAVGFAVSFLAIWTISYLLVDDPLPYIFDAEANRMVTQPGMYLSSQEGFGWTIFGRFGLAGHVDASKEIEMNAGNWVAVWGDSYVEGRQVSDEFKMARTASKIWASAEDSSMCFIGIGMSGWTIADIYFHLENYEKLLGPPQAHIIVISEIAEFLPMHREREGYFVHEPEFRFEASNWQPDNQILKTWINRFKLGFLWEILRDFEDGWNLRFHVGPLPKPPQKNPIKRIPNPEAVRFAVRSLQSKTNRPIAILVLSRAPTIGGNQIKTDDPFAEGIRVVESVCREEGIHADNTFDLYVDYTRRHRQFPRTFWTRYRGGHINRVGHRLTAEKIVQMTRQLMAKQDATVEATQDVVHTD